MNVLASNAARVESRRSPEEAFWELLRDCVADPQGARARSCVADVIEGADSAWAYDVLYASHTFASKDIERPEAPLIALVTDSEQKELVNIIVHRGSAEQMYQTMRTVFLYGDQKNELLRALKHSKDRTWIREALADLRLTPVQCSILTNP